MTKKTTPPTAFDPMQRIIDSAQQGKLIVIIGTGVSIGLTNGSIPSWTNLIKNGFEYGNKKGLITDAQLDGWSHQLQSPDIDDLLGAAEFMGRKLESPKGQGYTRWLESLFSSIKPTNETLISALQIFPKLGIPICTLNYDHLLESVTGLPTLLVSDTQKVISWIQRDYPAILHLHGSWETPESCVLGIRDYETTQTDEVRGLFQKSLATFNHLLFIGCGDTLADPNFSALIGWLRTTLQARLLPHVALVSESDLPTRNADPAWLGFVEPYSFGKQYDDLATFLLEKLSPIGRKKTPRIKLTNQSNSETIIESYRSFLLRDCGQMTIEGVSADMDTGQRKFDLERLFVPLNVSQCPPEFPADNPDSEAKLEQWHKKNKLPKPFGDVLAGHKKLALLALPGGGKTLLLKRLAVAYADPLRRIASSDKLPNLDLLPVLIRCREWRDHIRLPISTLLKNIGDITGQPNLSGLSDALVPLLKKGQVLLLVDGLDEIHNDADRTTFVDHLEAFLDQYKQIRIVVTSREAGFNLVAPSLSRFCSRWKLAPLENDAIELLCAHWHKLMGGETPAAIEEGSEVAATLVRNSSLRRLAENPLLLTMLLVVKHGAGGLPPDRVSLYGRAVDVLLDTWNIKGHESLNPKEAVPQLAYVAFQLMCMGKQTATEKELLDLLEEAREKHPNINRYAKDSPHEFLKRVELRSSLLLEAGYQIEMGRTVPFYQFRHLTFQEYLTAVAVVDGHYKDYQKNDTTLTPLEKYLLTEEWKEVIPMVSVLARKRAEPVLVELINKGNKLKNSIESRSHTHPLRYNNTQTPVPIKILLQCFIEEAEASSSTISAALQLIAYFAYGCRSDDDWETICRGPYGKELYSQAWALLISKKWGKISWIMNSCAAIAAYQEPSSFWINSSGQERVQELLTSTEIEKIGQGLLISMGILWNKTDEISASHLTKHIQLDLVEPLLWHKDHNIWSIAMWVWVNANRHRTPPKKPTNEILNLMLSHWLKEENNRAENIAAYALYRQAGINRDHWKPELTETQKLKVDSKISSPPDQRNSLNKYEWGASFLTAYHTKTIYSDKELLKKLKQASRLSPSLYSKNRPEWKFVHENLEAINKEDRP